MNAMLEVLQPVVTEVFRMSWQGSLLIVIVLMATTAARGWITARWRYLLCGIVLIRLLVPLLPQTSISLFNVVAWESAAFENRVVARSSMNRTEREVSPHSEHLESSAFSTGEFTVTEPQPIPAPLPAHTSGSVPDVLYESPFSTPLLSSAEPMLIAGLVWLIGMFVVLARTALQLRNDWRLLRRCLPASAEVTSRATSIAKQMKLQRSICLLVSPDETGPAATGIFCSSVVLPCRLLQTLTGEQLELVPRHELAHIQRGDIIIRWLMTAVRAIHWFNPVVRAGLNIMQRECELACDESVLSQLSPQGRTEYGHTLLSVVESSAGVQSTPLLIGMTKDGRHLQRRIEMIREFRPSARRQSIVALLAVFLLGVGGLTDAVQSTSGDEKTISDAANAVAKSEAEGITEEGKVYDLDFNGLQSVPKNAAIDAQRPHAKPHSRLPQPASKTEVSIQKAKRKDSVPADGWKPS